MTNTLDAQKVLEGLSTGDQVHVDSRSLTVLSVVRHVEANGGGVVSFADDTLHSFAYLKAAIIAGALTIQKLTLVRSENSH